MPSPILARADALMQRRRQNQTTTVEDVPVLTETVEDEEIPILRELAAPPPQPAPGLIAADPALIDTLTQELTQQITQRLEAEIPRLVEAAVRDYLGDQFVAPLR